jgi:transcriptional regulator of heat shock response
MQSTTRIATATKQHLSDTVISTQTRRKLPKPVTPEILDKIAKMANSDLSQREMGEITGLDRSTISRILSRYNQSNEDIKDYTDHRITLIRGVQDKLLNAITDDDIKKMQPTQKFMGYGILVDKEQALLGNNASNKPVIQINIVNDPRSLSSPITIESTGNTVDNT